MLNEISATCREQLQNFFSEQPEQLVQRYCHSVDIKLIVIIFVALAMYIFEPLVKKKLDKWDYDNGYFASSTFYFMYKWVLAGILFMVGYGLIIR